MKAWDRLFGLQERERPVHDIANAQHGILWAVYKTKTSHTGIPNVQTPSIKYVSPRLQSHQSLGTQLVQVALLALCCCPF
jgi:hypothetical protein